ncbi:DMT family transporter [Ruegeria meonggei]|uniref:EamA-like transporter family protein n=1 Tax=Ruegeria meonggei TaxID=1446476 RepID=A0A1X6YWT7_9RHOB|nr:DMT family transporter [Ruegeria meonggei]SLN33639.1 EamA-like transporter family protein [Ruegeria meonggei]
MTIYSGVARPQNVTRGIVLILATMFVTSVQDVVFKLYAGNLTLWQIFALRGILALPILFVLARIQGFHGAVLGMALQKWPLLRALFVTVTFLAFYGAIPFISLSTVGAANYIAPIIVTLLSAYFIGERVGPIGWVAVFVGFAGVVILLQPGADTFSPWAVLPVIGAGFYAISHITTRTKCQDVPLAAMVLSLMLVMTVVALAVSAMLYIWPPEGALPDAFPYVFGIWSPLGTTECLVLVLLAVFTVVISLGLAGAYQTAPPAIVATFEYCYLVYAAFWDMFIFESAPGFSTITGMVLIVGAGLMLLKRK